MKQLNPLVNEILPCEEFAGRLEKAAGTSCSKKNHCENVITVPTYKGSFLRMDAFSMGE